MIVSKKKSSKTKAKGASIRDLISYIDKDIDQEGKEKILLTNSRNFFSSTEAGQQEEMVALASEATKSKNPVNHYVLSWKEGEQPTPKQTEEALDIFLSEIEMEDHQVMYALHKNTDNIHLHIVLNRVHPDTLKCVEINKGFDLEAVHKAIAKIEHAQGWEPEENTRYTVDENGDAVRTGPDKQGKTTDKDKQDKEHETGEKSAERIAQEEAGPIITKAQSWEQLHTELADKGMRYRPKGSGAIVLVGDTQVKASAVHRKASFSQLQKRLGAYQEPPEGLRVADREPKSIEPENNETDSPWKNYIAERKSYYAYKNDVKVELSRSQENQWKQLRKDQKAERQELYNRGWKGKGQLLNAMRSVLAAEQAKEKAALKEQQKLERQQLAQDYQTFASYEKWLKEQGKDKEADDWRYRMTKKGGLAPSTPRAKEKPKPQDIRAYSAEIKNNEVHYFRDNTHDLSFIDRGNNIMVHDETDESILAALQLAQQKWGEVNLIGNKKFNERAARIAAQNNIRIKNQELQTIYDDEKAKIAEERRQNMKPTELKQFEQYAQAVGADRYRVTCIKMQSNGNKKTFILDKKDGETKGFTPDEIAKKTWEMKRLQQRGENIYYTPLSAEKHHILIDDMNSESYQRLIDDGFKPAVLLESSPGNYQAIITIPKLKTSHDKDVANRLTEQLNKEYGDKNLSGCIHPHRAPGYQNRKPKHQREDGSYPDVKILKSENRECDKALDLSRGIDQQYEQQEHVKPPKQNKKTAQEIVKIAAPDGSLLAVYDAHRKDILSRQSGKINLSRVDSMIALRMRMTGHSHEEIESTIRQCAPLIRSEGDSPHNWDDYAQRTANYAFSAKAEMDTKKLHKYTNQWKRLEGQVKADPQRDRGRDIDMGM